MSNARRSPPEDVAAAAESLVRLGDRYLTWPELCSRAGVEHEVADRLWRALGFPDVPPDEPAYTDDDVRALEIAAEGLGRLDGGERQEAIELMVREARAISAYLTRIGEIQVDTLLELQAHGLREQAITDAFEHGIADSELGWLLFYGLRRRLDETLRRRATSEPGEQEEVAVGFVDMVDFTRTSGSLDADEFGRLLNGFESLVWDIVTEAGGQVVKLIGDEAMFVCPSAAQAAEAAVQVISASGRSEIPPSRGGLAAGLVLHRYGDYFGRAVNTASRLVDRAEPGTVLVDEALREGLNSDAGFQLHDRGTERLKGIGEMPVWLLVPGRS